MATTTVTIAPSIRSTRVSGSIDLGDSATVHKRQQHLQQQQQDNVDVSSSPPDDTTSPPETESKPFKPTRRFWLVMMSISAISLCGAVEGTIIVNALPSIASALGGGNLYLWVPNAFFLASMAVLPLFAQVSDIFGRRTMLLGALSLFVLGCALGGASTSMTMLIGARTIQGVGSGGTDTLSETIILDLVPLRERGKYMSIVSVGTILGYALGPFVGGLIVEKLGWPWVFYINAITGGASLTMFFFFLRVKHQHGQNFWSKIKRIDFGGNAIFIGAVIAVLLALTWGGPVYHWNSPQIIAPLVIGLLGLVAFTAFEWTPRLAPEPSFPRILVSNRTSASALAMTLLQSITTTGTFYFLPVYFQGVLAKSPLNSGIALAPIAATIIPFCLVNGILLSKVGKYRPLHLVGWALIVLSLGLFSILNRNSSTAVWAVFEIISAAGIGSLSVSLLPAIQAPLPEKQAATSAGMYTFARSFGSIWGVTIPSAVFNNVVKNRVLANPAAFVTNTTLAARLADGQAYQLATKAFLDSIPSSDSAVRESVIAVFEEAIHYVFYVLIAIAGVGLLLVGLEKEVVLRTENNTEFGLDEGDDDKKKTATSDAGVGATAAAADVGVVEAGTGTAGNISYQRGDNRKAGNGSGKGKSGVVVEAIPLEELSSGSGSGSRSRS